MNSRYSFAEDNSTTLKDAAQDKLEQFKGQMKDIWDDPTKSLEDIKEEIKKRME